MSYPTIDRTGNRVGELAGAVESITARLQAGERLSIEAIADEYPEYAQELAELVPAMQSLMSLPNSTSAGGGGPAGTTSPMLGDFRIVREIGRGGMGIVYEAEQLSLGRRVALKVLPAAATLEPRHLERFKNEAKAVAALRHEHIVHVYGVGCERGVHYYAMEYIEGQSLAQYIRSMQAGGGLPAIGNEATADFSTADRLTKPVAGSSTHACGPRRRDFFRSAAKRMQMAAQALDHAHRHGTIHRDIKPGNLLIDNVGGLWVSDFGLARLGADNGLTFTGDLLGTLRYMSPEQAAGKHRAVDHRADIYSLGATLYELITLRAPFTSASREELLRQVMGDEPVAPRRLDGAIPAELETITLKAMAKEPAARYATAREMADDLGRFLAGEPILARRVGRVQRSWRWCRRNPLVAGLMAAVVAVAAAGLVGVLGQWQVALANEQKAVHAAADAQQNADEVKVQRDEARRLEAEAQRQRDEVRAANEKLLAAQKKLEATIYAAHINLAQQAMEKGAVDRVLQLLEEHRPKPGANDVRGWEWHYLYGLCRANELPLEAHLAPIHRATFSPDGDALATASDDHTVRIWNIDDGKEQMALKGHPREVRAVAYSPDGTRIVSGSAEWVATNRELGEVKLWDAASGRELLTISSTGGIQALAISPDNKQMAGSSSVGAGIHVWDAVTGSLVREFSAAATKSAYVSALAYSADGRWLASALAHGDYVDERGKRPPGEIKLWDATTGELVQTLAGHTLSVWAVAFHSDGKRLASGSEDSTVRIWDFAEGKELRTIKTEARYTHSIAFSPDGKRLASGHQSKLVKVWETETGEAVSTFAGHTGRVAALKLFDDGKCLAGSYSGASATIKKWHVDPTKSQISFRGHNVPLFSPDGRLIATSVGAVPTIYDSATAEQVRQFAGHSGGVSRLAISPDGQRLASTSFDRSVKVWDIASGAELFSHKHDAVAMGVAFSPDGKQLAGGYWNGTVKIWDTDTWQQVQSLRDEGNIYHVAFLPDGKRLVASTWAAARIWDAGSGRVLSTLQAQNGECIGLAVSQDGKLIAGGCGNAIYLWDVETGLLVRKLLGPTDAVNRLAFSPDGKRLASGGYDRTVRLWDVESGQLLLSFTGGGVAFSPDGNRFVIGSGPTAGTSQMLDGRPLPERKPRTVPVGVLTRGQIVAEGWMAVGRRPDDYQIGIDRSQSHDGKASAFIFAKIDEPLGSAEISQSVEADQYRGKRVRLSGYLKTEEARNGGWLSLFVTSRTTYAYSNMFDRRVGATTEWQRYTVVLDVPEDATALSLGVGFAGSGKIWADDLAVEIVSADVPTDPLAEEGSLVSLADPSPWGWKSQKELMNLDFESERTPEPVAVIGSTHPLALGWLARGNLEDYDVKIDADVKHVGAKSGAVISKAVQPNDVGGLVQRFKADEYRGKRIRISAYIKAENIEGAARMWARVDGQTTTVLDNMDDRLIKGSREWTLYDIVLDVPSDALKVNLGLSLRGAGKVWLDDMRVETIDAASPLRTTNLYENRSAAHHHDPSTQAMPMNLDFEQ